MCRGPSYEEVFVMYFTDNGLWVISVTLNPLERSKA